MTLIPLYKPENEAEANALHTILEENDIYSEVLSFHDTAYDGLFQSQYGWGVIKVHQEDRDSARKIITEWKAAAPSTLPWADNPEP